MSPKKFILVTRVGQKSITQHNEYVVSTQEAACSHAMALFQGYKEKPRMKKVGTRIFLIMPQGLSLKAMIFEDVKGG